MPDKEIQAIEKCTEYINELEDEAKIRVIQYLVSRFNLTPQTSNQTNSNKNGVPTSHQIGSSTFDNNNVIDVEGDFDYPAIQDIVRKDLPKSEVEWVLLYCLYSSNFGEQHFTREQIISAYETSKRWAGTNKKNLSGNLTAVIKKDWIKSINEKDFIMLEAGIIYSQEVISGNSVTKQRKPAKRNKKTD